MRIPFIGAAMRRAVIRTVRQFEVRLERYKLVSRRTVRDQLLADAAVRSAMARHRREHRLGEMEVRVRVEQYIDEIVPFFNVLSYYRLGYNLARTALRMLFRVTSEYQDRAALNAIPRNDVVVYLMNHRSNADYVVVAFVLARGVSISYAVGEWARVWPLEYVFKSFGAYFVRRQFREPLYHTVLERYVQLITRNGVTQGIFLEGGLSRDGAARPPKLGLLDYIARTLLDPAFDRDIWLVPVALNYDRVLEDRALIRELLEPDARPGRIRQILGLIPFVGANLVRLATGHPKRYGRVAVNFGTPTSLRRWASSRPGVLDLDKERRLRQLDHLGHEILDRIAAIMPVTPVPLAAAALLSFGRSVVPRQALLERLEEYRDHLMATNAKLVHTEASPTAILGRAWKTLGIRRLVIEEEASYVILPGQRPLLEFYANSVRHLLPAAETIPGPHPAHEPEEGLPALRRTAERQLTRRSGLPFCRSAVPAVVFQPMPTPVDLPSLPLGSHVHDTFLVLDVEARQSGNGEPFTVLTLGNSTGEIATAPFWLEHQEQVAGLRRGHVVQVIGDVASYRDRRQLRVVSVRHLPDGVADVNALLPSVGPVQKYWDTLDGWRRDLKKPRLARVVGLFYDDEEFRRQYEQCPASVRGHHAAIGGLLKHTTEVAAIARTIARACGADLELVLAGALLHDIGKLEAYTWHGVFDHTAAGSTIGHVTLGALMLDRRLSQEPEPPCTPAERDILLHLILAHHGKREFGSPVEPMTLEAEVLHWADNASAKTASLADALREGETFWKLEGRRLHRASSDWGGSAHGEEGRGKGEG